MNYLFNIDVDLILYISLLLSLSQLYSLLHYKVQHLLQIYKQYKIQMKEHVSAFLYEDISYFFSNSQIVDYHLGLTKNYSIQASLSLLEQQSISVDHLLPMFASLFKGQGQNIPKTNPKKIEQLINNDGMKILFACFSKQIQRLQLKDGDSLQNQMSLKILMNIIFVCIDFLENNPTHSASSLELNELYKDTNIDDLLMKLVTLSLEVHYIPVKKLTMLYTIILSNLFHHFEPKKVLDNISPQFIFEDSQSNQLPIHNLLRMGEFEKYKSNHPPPTQPLRKQKINSIQHFYRKHNTGECPLAQSIVVGLLRSLLTICNCQAHKKFITSKGAGVDSFREWQLSYRWLIAHPQLISKLPSHIQKRLKKYQDFDQQPTNQGQIWSEFYTHKIQTTAAITCFFTFLLISFKQNLFLQFSYFLQLISDANGILVFLKFLTDKFNGLDAVTEDIRFSKNNIQKDQSFGFRQKTMLTIHSVLLMLYASCNNYPQKIRNYLFQYNSYLIIKKIPALFTNKEREKLKSSNNKQEEPVQNAPANTLPSREQLEQLQKQNKGCSASILLKLTQLCFDLLKIQIPFFSKKMKENAANMKLIIDIYCKFPKKTVPITLTPLQKLILKAKGQNSKQQKMITSVQQMKSIHNEYNNLYYWGNDFLQEPPLQSTRIVQNLNSIVEPQQWLEENIWKYYD